MMNYIRNTVNAGISMGLAALLGCSSAGLSSCSTPQLESTIQDESTSMSYKEMQKMAGMSQDEQQRRDIWDKIFSQEEEYKKVPSQVRNWRRNLTMRPDNPIEGDHGLVLVQLTHDSKKYLVCDKKGSNAVGFANRYVRMPMEKAKKIIKIPKKGFDHYDIAFRHVTKNNFWHDRIEKAADKLDCNKDGIISGDEQHGIQGNCD